MVELIKKQHLHNPEEKTADVYIDSNKIGEVTYNIPDDKSAGYIKDIWINEKFRGIHLSQKIISQVVSDMKCKGLSKVELHAISPLAKKVWIPMGFKTKKILYKNQKDKETHLMEMNLNSVVSICIE